jgi:hypothetical protein
MDYQPNDASLTTSDSGTDALKKASVEKERVDSKGGGIYAHPVGSRTILESEVENHKKGEAK